jgi:hypothetical protein
VGDALPDSVLSTTTRSDARPPCDALNSASCDTRISSKRGRVDLSQRRWNDFADRLRSPMVVGCGSVTWPAMSRTPTEGRDFVAGSSSTRSTHTRRGRIDGTRRRRHAIVLIAAPKERPALGNSRRAADARPCSLLSSWSRVFSRLFGVDEHRDSSRGTSMATPSHEDDSF